MSIPLFARPGSIIPFGAQDNGVLYDYARNAQYRVYALGEGERAKTCIYGMDGKMQSRLSVCRDEEGYEIDYQGEMPCEVVLLDECGQTALCLNGKGIYRAKAKA